MYTGTFVVTKVTQWQGRWDIDLRERRMDGGEWKKVSWMKRREEVWRESVGTGGCTRGKSILSLQRKKFMRLEHKRSHVQLAALNLRGEAGEEVGGDMVIKTSEEANKACCWSTILHTSPTPRLVASKNTLLWIKIYVWCVGHEQKVHLISLMLGSMSPELLTPESQR